MFTQALAHGMDESQVETEDVATVRKPRWVTALGALPYSDMFASGTSFVRRLYISRSLRAYRAGSWDGEIRFWKLDSKLKSFSLVGSIPALGVVNALQFITPPPEFVGNAPWAARSSADANGAAQQPAAARRKKVSTVLMVAAVGKEPRLGRWVQKKGEGVVNGAMVVALHPRTLSSS